MPRYDKSLLREYRENHPEALDEIYFWIDLFFKNDAANRITFAYEDWLKTDRSTPPPDLVEWFAWYGYINLRLRTWELPIKLSAAEKERWRAAGYYVSQEDFQYGLGSVAAGIFDVARVDPRLTVRIMRQQLDEKLAELERLADLSIDEYYTPRWQEWQIWEMGRKNGLRGKELEDAVEEELLEDPHLFEVKEFEKPFTLRQQLESFEWGMECLRLICLGETAPELDLPNMELFRALLRIDVNELSARLAAIDVKLKRIWQNLAKYRCYCLNESHEPKRFWWRHWQQPTKQRSSR